MREPLTWRESQLIQQAQIWKAEARCANHTIGQIYQLVSGAKGEPGNWNGAEPVKALIDERDDLRRQVMESARRDCPWKCYPNDPKCLCEPAKTEVGG